MILEFASKIITASPRLGVSLNHPLIQQRQNFKAINVHL
jgi:hypothetical protein